MTIFSFAVCTISADRTPIMQWKYVREKGSGEKF